MNEAYYVNNEVFEKAAKMTAERADKMYLAFKEKGYNNDTCAEFTKQLLLSIYSDATSYVLAKRSEELGRCSI